MTFWLLRLFSHSAHIYFRTIWVQTNLRHFAFEKLVLFLHRHDDNGKIDEQFIVLILEPNTFFDLNTFQLSMTTFFFFIFTFVFSSSIKFCPNWFCSKLSQIWSKLSDVVSLKLCKLLFPCECVRGGFMSLCFYAVTPDWKTLMLSKIYHLPVMVLSL